MKSSESSGQALSVGFSSQGVFCHVHSEKVASQRTAVEGLNEELQPEEDVESTRRWYEEYVEDSKVHVRKYFTLGN